MLKALAKFLVILAVALVVLSVDQDDLLAIANEPIEPAILHSLKVVGWSAFWLSCGLILIAAVDAPFQLWSHKQKLKMTKQEVRDEYKDTEGKPEVKGRIRQLQREMAERRMMQAVPQADVVITNPTHFAVALKYDQKTMAAPVVVAKGRGVIAQKIRELADEAEVPRVEAPPLARALYAHVDIGQTIPPTLFAAVAEILAYVFQLDRWMAVGGPKPQPPQEVPVPPELDPGEVAAADEDGEHGA